MPRTTINIQPNLLKQAKQEAIDRDIPLQQVMNEALEIKLRRPKNTKREFKLRTGKIGKPTSTYRREEIYDFLIEKHSSGQ